MCFCLVFVPPRGVTQYAENYIHISPTPNQHYDNETIAFFAASVKAPDIPVPLEGHFPQFFLDLVARAKHLGYVTFCAPMPLTFRV